MAFVAHARPEQSDTHTCSLNKGIGCKSRTRKESVAGTAVCTFEIASTRQDSESSCISKVLFSMREIPACGENRSLEGLSWPGEKAEAMRLCEGKFSAHEWISQETYKKPSNHSPSRTVVLVSQVTEAMISPSLLFFISFRPCYGRRREERRRPLQKRQLSSP